MKMGTSPEKNIISIRYLTSIYLGHASADIILKKLLGMLSSFSISLWNFLSLILNTPNENRSILCEFRSIVKDHINTGIC